MMTKMTKMNGHLECVKGGVDGCLRVELCFILRCFPLEKAECC